MLDVLAHVNVLIFVVHCLLNMVCFVGLAHDRNNVWQVILVMHKLEDLETQTWKTREGMKQVS